MSEDLYAKIANSEKRDAESYDKAKYAEKMKKQRAAVSALTEKTMESIRTDSAAFRRYLLTQERFDRYSVNNAALVSAQFPDATELHSYGEWRTQKVYVDEGATKILVLEAGDTYTREDGTLAQGFDVKTLYDVSQTSAKDEPAEQEPKAGDELLCGIMSAKPVPFELRDDLPEPCVYSAEKKKIFLRTNQPDEVLLVNIPKEVAAALFNVRYGESRASSAFKSMCVMYMLLARYGAADIIGEPPELPKEAASMSQEEFKAQLSQMRAVLREILQSAYLYFKEHDKENAT